MNLIKNVLIKFKIFIRNPTIKSSLENYSPHIFFSTYFGFTFCLNYSCYKYLLSSGEYVYIHQRTVLL